MKKGFWEAELDSSVANEPNNPLDRALKAKKVLMVKTALGGGGASRTWLQIYAPADFGGPEDLDLTLWARWQPSKSDAPIPASLAASNPVVDVYDDAKELAKKAGDAAAGFGSGLAILLVLYLLAKG